MTTYELERLLNVHFGELSVRERQIAIRSAELYRGRMLSHWKELRENAAIAAMQGILSGTLVEDYETTAENAVGYADALIEELKKEK